MVDYNPHSISQMYEQYSSTHSSKPSNANKTFADSMKAGGGGTNLSGSGSSAMEGLMRSQREQTQKDNDSKPDEDVGGAKSFLENAWSWLSASGGEPEKPKVYDGSSIYSRPEFDPSRYTKPINFSDQDRRIDDMLNNRDDDPGYKDDEYAGSTYDEVKPLEGVEEYRSTKARAEGINNAIKGIMDKEDDDSERKFYQSGVPMDQRTFERELGYDETPLPSEATVDKKIRGLGDRTRPEVTVSEIDATDPTTLTAAQRTALSDMGSDVVRTNLQNITNAQGNYSQTALTNALDKGIKNTNKKALLKGAVETEIGDRGLVTEATGYRLNKAYEMFNDGIVDAALASLPQSEQTRIRNGAASNALGLAIMDRRYDGGSNFRGRGLVQLTHRENYQAVQNILASNGININLVGNPDLANDTRYALPIAMAYLEHAGLDDDAADNSSAKDLNNRINAGANSTIANERWDNVVQALRDAGKDSEADTMENRNEYAAQQTVGTAVDGIIGANSRAAMTTWLTERNITIPQNATDMDLVVLVNENS